MQADYDTTRNALPGCCGIGLRAPLVAVEHTHRGWRSVSRDISHAEHQFRLVRLPLARKCLARLEL